MKRFFCAVLIVCLGLGTFYINAVNVTAKSAILINGHTGEVLYSINQNQRLPMASTTKIMTGLLLCEYGNFEREITVNREMVAVEGSSMGLLVGDKVTLHDLLYGLLLASGNDAANVIAYAVAGSVSEFVALMNKKASEIGLENTNFVTPSGLDSAEHYTTASDMAKLASYALKNDQFAKAVSTKTATLNYGNPPYRRRLSNHNKLLNMYDGAVGVKTGYTKKSGRCLVSAAKRDGRLLIAVTLNDSNDWADHKQMLDYGFSVTQKTEICKQMEFQVPIIGGKEQFLKLNVDSYYLGTTDKEGFSYEIFLPKFVYAPINDKEIIGKIVYKKYDNIIDEIEIKANKNVDKLEARVDVLKATKEIYRYIFMKIWEN